MTYQTRCDVCGSLTGWITKKAAVEAAEKHALDHPSHYQLTRVTSR